MSNSNSDELQERERINATFKSFTGLDSWTPAMGALLVSGLVPAGRPHGIPVGAGAICSVRNLAVAANEQEIQWARKVLENWLDGNVDDDDEASRLQALKAEIKPSEFLLWAMEDYDGSPAFMTPPWLDYLLALLEWKHQDNVPLPAPSSLVTRASALEKLVPLNGIESTPTKSIPQTVSSDDATYVEQLSASLRRTVEPVLAKRIIEALGRSENPRVLKSVWTQLCKMAESKKYDDLKFDGEGEISIPAAGKMWKRYTRDALRQCLRKHRPK